MPPPKSSTNAKAAEPRRSVPRRGSANSPLNDAVPIAAPRSCSIRAGVCAHRLSFQSPITTFVAQIAAPKIKPTRNKELAMEVTEPLSTARIDCNPRAHSTSACALTMAIAMSKRRGLLGDWVLISRPRCDTILGLSVGLYLQNKTQLTLGITENYGYDLAKSGPMPQ